MGHNILFVAIFCTVSRNRDRLLATGSNHHTISHTAVARNNYHTRRDPRHERCFCKSHEYRNIQKDRRLVGSTELQLTERLWLRMSKMGLETRRRVSQLK